MIFFTGVFDLCRFQAIIVSCCGCFHGRTLAAISMSCDNEATRGFWPLVPGNLKVDFGDKIALEKIFRGLLTWTVLESNVILLLDILYALNQCDYQI